MCLWVTAHNMNLAEAASKREKGKTALQPKNSLSSLSRPSLHDLHDLYALFPVC